eukprot:5893880-Lingulodinium_polyedra.AAC.1
MRARAPGGAGRRRRPSCRNRCTPCGRSTAIGAGSRRWRLNWAWARRSGTTSAGGSRSNRTTMWTQPGPSST